MLIAVTELRTKEEIDQLVARNGGLQCITKINHSFLNYRKKVAVGYSLPELDVPEVDLSELLPEEYLREEAAELTGSFRIGYYAPLYSIISPQPWRRFWILSTRFLYDEIQSKN